MRLVYLTSKTFPSSKVEPFMIKSLANAFFEHLGNDFTLFIRGSIPQEFARLNVLSAKVPNRLKSISYFLLLPIFIFRNNWSRDDVVFFSSDPYILAALIFWRKMFSFKYLICTECHQLFENWTDKYVLLNSDRIISTSEKLKKLLVSTCQVSPDKIAVPYGGVDISIFDKKQEKSKEDYKKILGLPLDRFIVGYAGAFKAMHYLEKGIGTMIKSLPKVDKSIIMVFVGGTREEIEEYAHLAKECQVEDRCIFVEKQPFEKLVEYELALDVIVIPNPASSTYYTDYAFPFKIWEYLCSGTPIIYSNLEIIDEVLRDRGASFIPENPDSLAESIIAVRKNFEFEEKKANLNSGIVRSLYTWNARAKKIIDFIKN
ncbi:MAG: glycosyltransferase family 4 protein [Crocinitomicaceae bacterium]